MDLFHYLSNARDINTKLLLYFSLLKTEYCNNILIPHLMFEVSICYSAFKIFSEKVLTTFHVVVNKLTVYGIIWLIILIHHQVFQFVVGGIRIQSSQMTHEEEGAKNVIIRAPYCLNEVYGRFLKTSFRQWYHASWSWLGLQINLNKIF